MNFILELYMGMESKKVLQLLNFRYFGRVPNRATTFYVDWIEHCCCIISVQQCEIDLPYTQDPYFPGSLSSNSDGNSRKINLLIDSAY